MDALSDILKSVSLAGAVFLDAEFHAPWCVRTRFGLDRARAKLPADAHVALFHLLTEGRCKVRLDDGADLFELVAGDLVLFAHDDRHLIGSDLDRLPLDAPAMAEPDADGPTCTTLRLGGPGEATRFVCGYVAFDRVLSRGLLQGLPRMLRVDIAATPAAALVRELLRAGVHESASDRPGAASSLTKLSELLLVEAVRAHVESQADTRAGWLAGLRDRHVGKALALLHGDPSRAWTVDELARDVALSRSALAERFTDLVGESPMQYLLRWRLSRAARTLLGGDPISQVAARSGYESEAAFSRAFKREFGLPPAAWRKRAAA
ncbi:MAG TPA: AraC family transcriptional regulator [Dokdonella sp.]|nr:AraC family transcriptional regulator [Dokdonella sp.]